MYLDKIKYLKKKNYTYVCVRVVFVLLFIILNITINNGFNKDNLFLFF